MSKYPSLLPDDLSSNEYIAADGIKYTMSASSLYEPHYPYQFLVIHLRMRIHGCI